VYKVANGLSDNFNPLFQPIRLCCSICYQVTTLANNLHHLALTSLTPYCWVVRLPSSYFGYTGFKIGPSIAYTDRLFCGFAQSTWRMSMHAPTIYVPPSPISRFLSTPPSYLDINLQVIQLPYITYEPIKSTTWPNWHFLNRNSSEYFRNGEPGFISQQWRFCDIHKFWRQKQKFRKYFYIECSQLPARSLALPICLSCKRDVQTGCTSNSI